MSVGEEPLAVLFPLNLQIQAVQSQLQLRLTASQGVQRSVLRPAILPGLLLLIVQPLQVLRVPKEAAAKPKGRSTSSTALSAA